MSAERSEAPTDITLMHRLEIDLHQDIVLQCTNAELRSTIYRCQLPLLTALLNFGIFGHDPGADMMFKAHRRVYELLVEQRIEDAAAALGVHIREGLEVGPSRFAMLQPNNFFKHSSYLDLA